MQTVVDPRLLFEPQEKTDQKSRDTRASERLGYSTFYARRIISNGNGPIRSVIIRVITKIAGVRFA